MQHQRDFHAYLTTTRHHTQQLIHPPLFLLSKNWKIALSLAYTNAAKSINTKKENEWKREEIFAGVVVWKAKTFTINSRENHSKSSRGWKKGRCRIYGFKCIIESFNRLLREEIESRVKKINHKYLICVPQLIISKGKCVGVIELCENVNKIWQCFNQQKKLKWIKEKK